MSPEFLWYIPKDSTEAYGDVAAGQGDRYARTREFLQLLRRLWTEDDVSYAGRFYQVGGSTVLPRIEARGGRTHPLLYFGGASAAAEEVAATEADVQLFWGEPLVTVRTAGLHVRGDRALQRQA